MVNQCGIEVNTSHSCYQQDQLLNAMYHYLLLFILFVTITCKDHDFTIFKNTPAENIKQQLVDKYCPYYDFHGNSYCPIDLKQDKIPTLYGAGLGYNVATRRLAFPVFDSSVHRVLREKTSKVYMFEQVADFFSHLNTQYSNVIHGGLFAENLNGKLRELLLDSFADYTGSVLITQNTYYTHSSHLFLQEHGHGINKTVLDTKSLSDQQQVLTGNEDVRDSVPNHHNVPSNHDTLTRRDTSSNQKGPFQVEKDTLKEGIYYLHGATNKTLTNQSREDITQDDDLLHVYFLLEHHQPRHVSKSDIHVQYSPHTAEFKIMLDSLPDTFDANNETHVNMFEIFFDLFGTGFAARVEHGGIIYKQELIKKCISYNDTIEQECIKELDQYIDQTPYTSVFARYKKLKFYRSYGGNINDHHPYMRIASFRHNPAIVHFEYNSFDRVCTKPSIKPALEYYTNKHTLVTKQYVQELESQVQQEQLKQWLMPRHVQVYQTSPASIGEVNPACPYCMHDGTYYQAECFGRVFSKYKIVFGSSINDNATCCGEDLVVSLHKSNITGHVLIREHYRDVEALVEDRFYYHLDGNHYVFDCEPACTLEAAEYCGLQHCKFTCNCKGY
jgi:hypothetical protein